jgi:hypothetical protein
MLRSIVVAVAFQFIIVTAAMACDGQVGNVIFGDNFSDDSGGWDLNTDDIKIIPPSMQLSISANKNSVATQNLTFNATDGDYCAEFVLPAQLGTNRVAFGMEFLAADYSNTMLFIAFSDKSVALFKRATGTWAQVFTIPHIEAIKTEANAVNAMRVEVKAGKLALTINGQAVKVIRAQVPSTNLRFGVYAQQDDVSAVPPVITVKSFNVTAGK